MGGGGGGCCIPRNVWWAYVTGSPKLTWPQNVERREKLAEKVWKEGDLPSCACPLIKLLQISYKYGICSLPTGKTILVLSRGGAFVPNF